MPKHIPKKGISRSLAYFILFILPSMPRSPKPPGTRIPDISLSKIFFLDFCIFSELIHFISTLVLFSAPPWLIASTRDL